MRSCTCGGECMSHTKEPWHVSGRGKHLHIGAMTSPMVLASMNDVHTRSEENARRIVACVNACEHIPTEWLEQNGAYAIPTPSVRDAIKERDTYRDLCVELLKAAQGYVPYMPTSTAKEGGANRHSGMLRASDNLKDAITKSEKILGEKNGTAN